MHGYWRAVITTFVDELAGSHGFSLIPPDGLGIVVSVNPRLLLLLSLFWRMLENKAGQPSLSGTQRRKDGTGMLVIIPLVGRKKLK